jgi:branched-chain amino acid aminotransferase
MGPSWREARLDEGMPYRLSDCNSRPFAISRPPAIVDGVVTLASEAVVPAKDGGLLRGDGAFEVVRVYLGRPWQFVGHLDRLEASCRALRLPCPRAAFERDFTVLLTVAGRASYDVRIVLTRGGLRLLLLEPIEQLDEPVRLALVVDQPRPLLTGVKSLSYAGNMLAKRIAQERGSDYALLVTPEGRVLEVQTAAIFLVTSAGDLVTPPLSDGILDSITRRAVMQLVSVEEVSCTISQVLECSEAFIAGTVDEIRPVAAVEDHRLLFIPGRVTEEVRRAYRRYIETTTGVDFDEHTAFLRENIDGTRSEIGR